MSLACGAFAQDSAAEEALTPDDGTVYELSLLHRQAEGLVIENKFREALRVYQDILFIEPDDEVAYANSGRIYLILGDVEKAENAFTNALDININNETAIIGMMTLREPERLAKITEQLLQSSQTAGVTSNPQETPPAVVRESAKETIAPVPLPATKPEVPSVAANPEPVPTPKPVASVTPEPSPTPKPVVSVAPPVPAVKKQIAPKAAPTPRPAPSAPAPATKPKLYDKPAAVAASPLEKEIQLALKSAGVYKGAVDGKRGPETVRAIRSFQQFLGFEADGKVGPKTWAMLKLYLDAGGESADAQPSA